MGHLELAVMEALWKHGRASVTEVSGWLDRPLAYNTVMTTLDRLHKKGLLERTKQERAYIYSPRLSRLEWRQKQAESLVAGFISASSSHGELLVSCLVDAVGQYDAALLDDLEERIRRKRLELGQGREE